MCFGLHVCVEKHNGSLSEPLEVPYALLEVFACDRCVSPLEFDFVGKDVPA
jgi:hypothetical protein